MSHLVFLSSLGQNLLEIHQTFLNNVWGKRAWKLGFIIKCLFKDTKQGCFKVWKRIILLRETSLKYLAKNKMNFDIYYIEEQK